MSQLQLRHVGLGRLKDVDVTLPAGCHVFLGRPSDGTAALVEVAAGILRPRRGRVLVEGQEPWASPAARRRIGALLEHERLPPGKSVSDAVGGALRLRNDGASTESVLGRLGISSWGKRHAARLSGAETRAVGLALALSVPDATLLVLHEPLSIVGGVDQDVVLRHVERVGQLGVCVVCTTASARDAALISDSVFLLDQGRLARRLAGSGSLDLTPGAPIELAVRVSDARPLLERLAQDPDVTAVRWDQEAAPRDVFVCGRDTSRVSLAVLRAAQSGAFRVEALLPLP